MKRKFCLIMTLVISALFVISAFSGIMNAYEQKRTEESLVVVKDVWDGSAWVDEIDADPGDTVKFRITITYYNITDPQNSHQATWIIVNDTLPECFDYVEGSSDPQEPTVSGNLLTYNFYNSIVLYHEESLVITFEATIPMEGCSGTKINIAEVEAQEICTGQELFGEDTATVNVFSGDPTIDVEKYVFDGCDWVELVYTNNGEEVTFKIVVENTGEVDLLNVFVNDTLPDDFEYVTGSSTVDGIPQEPTFDGDVFYWYFSLVEVGDIIEILFNATVYGESCTEYDNWVSVTGENECGIVVEDEDSASVFVNGMCMQKKVWNGQEWAEETIAGVGETVSFKITVCYYGDYTLYDIMVRDELPVCLDYVSGSSTPEEPEVSSDGRILWWNLSDDYDLQDGECVSIEFDAIITCEECDELENLANVTATECSGNTFYGEDTAIVHIECTLTADAGGPYYGNANEDIEIVGSATGGNPPYEYYWDLDYDGQFDDATGKVVTWSWSAGGVYTIDLKVVDEDSKQATDISVVTIYGGNNPPNRPTISGPTSGSAGTEYEYTFVSTDSDGDDVSYYIKWGDGNITDWTAFQASGPPGYSESHAWSEQDEYTIEAKAKDAYGAESDWATLTVTMPRNRAINTPFFNFLQNFLTSHPNLFPILQLLLQRLGLQ